MHLAIPQTPNGKKKVKLEIRNGYFVLGSFLKRTKGLREEIRPLQVVHSFSVTSGTPP